MVRSGPSKAVAFQELFAREGSPVACPDRLAAKFVASFEKLERTPIPPTIHAESQALENVLGPVVTELNDCIEEFTSAGGPEVSRIVYGVHET